MNVFISWSGKRSKAMAYEISKWLHYVNHYIHPWMSDRDLPKGSRWFQTIGNKLSESQIGIICVTPENLESPWLYFEAGAISKELGESKVCPVLFGITPEDLEGPLSQFQSTSINKDDMFKLVKSLNNELHESKLESDVIEKSFETFWPCFEDSIKSISKMPIDSVNIRSVLKSFDNHGLPKPVIGRLICFSEGFESHLLYQALCELSKNRLYIWGRKNRKLFDKEHYDFIGFIRNNFPENFDFRCLFLDPNSDEHIISKAHRDSDFLDQLKKCIQHAIDVLKSNNIEPNLVCRAYNTLRHDAMIISDDIVLFTPIEFDSSGITKMLTKCSFQLLDVNLPLGKELLENFLLTWENSKQISSTMI